jgi:hypothetical protein
MDGALADNDVNLHENYVITESRLQSGTHPMVSVSLKLHALRVRGRQ